MRLISDVGRDTSCRVFIETLNILPLSCMYIMDTVHCIMTFWSVTDRVYNGGPIRK